MNLPLKLQFFSVFSITYVPENSDKSTLKLQFFSVFSITYVSENSFYLQINPSINSLYIYKNE